MYLIPYPAKLEEKEGSFTFTYRTYLCAQPGCSDRVCRQLALFGQAVKKALGYSGRISRGAGREGDIVFVQDDAVKGQGYRLEIMPGQVSVTGSESGLWHGMQTLLQIVEQNGAVLPALCIEDAPEIENRAYYFDSARGRVPKLSWLKELADRMAYYKMNQLQIYIEHSYLFRGMTELWRDDTPLTAAEIMELDQYCMERGIELVPSLSSFGHLYKLLSSKEYAHLCELEDSDRQPFSLKGRMHHHTINATDPQSLVLLKDMIGEYMELFSSRQFNICADETFDLGQGKSKKAVEELGKDRVYINYVKELAQFLVDNGRRPMFWGDVILGFPEMVRELPKEMVCLNWGYAWNQREEETKWMYEAGATQYCCPGCCGWNQFVTLNWNAYNNISRLCTYAKKYGAIGILNTDWGDFLHINHPDFSRTGMIYGAAFSWNTQIPSYEEINRQISCLEFHDRSGRFLEIVAKVLDKCAFEWEAACVYKELVTGNEEFAKSHRDKILEFAPKMEKVDDKNLALEEIKRELYGQIVLLDADKKELVLPYLIAVEGMRLFNLLGKVVYAADFDMKFSQMPDCWKLAKDLEDWLYDYKGQYRQVSKESELRRIQEVVCWYGDYLRTRKS